MIMYNSFYFEEVFLFPDLCHLLIKELKELNLPFLLHLVRYWNTKTYRDQDNIIMAKFPFMRLAIHK